MQTLVQQLLILVCCLYNVYGTTYEKVEAEQNY